MTSRTTKRGKKEWKEKRHMPLICLRSFCINHLLFVSFIILPDRLLLGIANSDLLELQCSFRPQIGTGEGQNKKQDCDFSTPSHFYTVSCLYTDSGIHQSEYMEQIWLPRQVHKGLITLAWSDPSFQE